MTDTLAAVPVPPIGAHPMLLFLLQVGVLLSLAIVLGRLAGRLGLPAIVGELSAGVLLGPSLAGWAAPGAAGWLLPRQPEQMHLLDAVGQVAVLLLVGLTGMETDLRMIRRRRSTALRVSLAGLLVPLGLGIALGYPLAGLLDSDSDTPVFVMFMGVAMCVSAIPVIAKTLMDMGLIHRDVGQLTLAAGMIDDAFGWMMLSVISAAAVGGLTAGTVGRSVGALVLVVVLAVVVGRPVVRRVLRRCGPSAERTVAAVAALLLMSAAGTQALGLEPVFGAFVCGILIGSSREWVPARTASLRTVVPAALAPVFFASAGLRIDLRALARPPVLAAALIVLAVAVIGKFTGAFVGARLSRLSRWEALALGAGMNARGVVEVIVAMVGLRLGVLTTDSYTIIVLVAVATSVMAPPILAFAMKRIDCTKEEELRLQAWGGPSVPSGEGVA
ncbi:cation:proton antiporter [Streptomyces sp. NPDC048281]|uniref:cation:proton antiporter n=1 Tax=Streptomyces sp. NPDC048281 TaxID=3154715 RepID=UPI00343C389F